MSWQDTIDEMREMARAYYIVYRYRGEVSVCMISHSMSYEYDRDCIIGPWYKTEQGARLALVAYKLERNMYLTGEEQEWAIEALQAYAESLKDE